MPSLSSWPTTHEFRLREEPTQLVATCACGAPLVTVQWSGADRDAGVARFRVGAEDTHRQHLAPPDPVTW
jgi:hypothetical protein